jgi:hypothetical protein
MTGSDGRFRLTAPPAEYQLTAERPGFFGPQQYGWSPGNASRKLTLVAGQQLPEQRLSLTPSGVITGRVLNPAGLPVNNATVAAVRIRRMEQGDERYLERVRFVSTNELGEYRLYWMPPGEYYVMYDQEQRTTASPTLIFGADSSNVLVRTFFPRATGLDAASTVTVLPGFEVKGIDIAAQTSTTFKISGKVVSPIAGLSVLPEFVLIHSEFGTQEIRIPTFSNPMLYTGTGDVARTGLFEIRAIPPGRYDLYAHMRNVAPGVTYSGKISIEIRTQDMKDVVIPLRSPVDVRGRVVITGNMKPPLGAWVGLAYMGNRLAMNTSGGGADADANGEVVVKGLPEGDYRIYPQVYSEDAFVADLKQGNRSVLKDGIVKVSGDVADEIEVVLAPNPGRVSGTVLYRDGKKSGETTVVLVPEPSLRSNPIRFRTFPTRESNTFNMLAIPPGSYKIFAWENAVDNDWMDSAFLAKYENQGVDVVVIGGQNTVIDVPVISLK